MSSLNVPLVELAGAALAQRPLDLSKFPEGNCVAGNPFFGDEGTGAALFPEFMGALGMHGAGDAAVGRITAILEAVDEAANESEFIVIGRTKKKIADLNAGELEFLVGYLKVARNMRARVDEVERAPTPPKPVGPRPAPTPAAPAVERTDDTPTDSGGARPAAPVSTAPAKPLPPRPPAARPPATEAPASAAVRPELVRPLAPPKRAPAAPPPRADAPPPVRHDPPLRVAMLVLDEFDLLPQEHPEEPTVPSPAKPAAASPAAAPIPLVRPRRTIEVEEEGGAGHDDAHDAEKKHGDGPTGKGVLLALTGIGICSVLCSGAIWILTQAFN